MNKHGTLELQCHTGPVTAIETCRQKIIWGCGSEISVFDLTTNKFETRKQILFGASVHGIRTGPSDEMSSLLCVYGAKQAVIVSIEPVEHNTDIIVLSDIMYFIDWVWDVKWLNNQGAIENIAVALAHNSVVRWDWKYRTISSQRECVEKCILYCARFIGTTWDNLMLAAGTVFNQIVLWPVAEKCHAAEKPVDVMHTLTGHQGVIFSIRYHPDLQRLCSVSDDRSIRMWKLIFPSGKISDPSLEEWRYVKHDLILLLYGHSARVWDVALAGSYFASIGEDSTCCIWNYSGNILHKFKGHKGRSIWGLATSADEKFVFTGGGDGSIRMWEVNQEKTQKTIQRVISVPQNSDLIHDDFPRIVKMLNFDLVLIMMNSGNLYSFSVSSQQFMLLASDSIFRSYSIVSPCPDQKKLTLGSITGVVCIVQLPETQDEETKHLEIHLFSGKVLALTWLDTYSFLASGPDGICLLLKVEEVHDTEKDDFTLCINKQYQLLLPPCKHRWITAACEAPSTDETCTSSHSFLVCGDKDGSIHCYALTDESTSSGDQNLKPYKSFARVHGKAGVTFICYREGFVYSAGRDGFYREWEIMAGNLSQLHGNKVIKGFEWIDRLEWYNNDLLIYGFFSSLFVVWSVKFNQQLMSVSCGGGHRAWGCCHDNEMLRFVYLKAGKVYMVDSGHQTKQVVVQPALHGNKICDTKVITVMSDDSADRPVHLVCTASEDTTINIGAFVYINNHSFWRPITTLKGHMSSVRALTLSSQHVAKGHKLNDKTRKDNLQFKRHLSYSADDSDSPTAVYSYSFLLFTGGGRAEINAWKLSIIKENASLSQNCKDISCNDIISLVEDDDRLINSLNENVHYAVSSNPHGDMTFNSPVDVSVPEQNAPSNVKSGHTGLLVSSSKFLYETSNHIQCNYQHLSTHFLGESRHKRFHWKSGRLRLDPETRVMSLDASCLTDLWSGYHNEVTSGNNVPPLEALEHLSRVHIVSSAGSDGVFRVFAFDEDSKRLSSLAENTYHQGCVLKVLHYIHQMEPQHYSLSISTSTNGRVVFWSLDSLVAQLASNILCETHSKSHSVCPQRQTSGFGSDGNSDNMKMSIQNEICGNDNSDDDEDRIDEAEKIFKEEKDWKPLSSLQAHQSGVNSLHAFQISASQFLLASGGDDNAVAVHLLEITESGLKVVAKVSREDAHAAQVTGIQLISSTLLISVSIDQRICLWNIKNVLESPLQLHLMICKYISVADVSSMSAYLYKNAVYLCIGGEGLCLYKLTNAGSDVYE